MPQAKDGGREEISACFSPPVKCVAFDSPLVRGGINGGSKPPPYRINTNINKNLHWQRTMPVSSHIMRKAVMAEKTQNTTIAQNKKALHDYFVLESYEAGIELHGTEVKSLRQGKCNLKDAWCSIVDGEIFVNGMHISPYDHGNIFNRDPMRVRKLLMHKKEIMRLLGTTKQQGLTLIPLSVYFKKGRAKVQVGLCKGKKLYDKRDVAAKKEANRNIEREMKERLR